MRKIIATFATELVKARPVQTLIIAVFFISAHSTSCCYSTDSRYLALSVLPKIENNSFFNFKNIFNPMARPIKNASRAKLSSSANTPAGAKSESSALSKTQIKILTQVKINCLKSDSFYIACTNLLKPEEL